MRGDLSYWQFSDGCNATPGTLPVGKNLADNGMGPALSILPSGSKFLHRSGEESRTGSLAALLILARARDLSNICGLCKLPSIDRFLHPLSRAYFHQIGQILRVRAVENYKPLD
jgi:hypothetical protein